MRSCLSSKKTSSSKWPIILGDPGADSGGEGKSKRAEKMARRKVKNGMLLPVFTFLGAIFFPPV